MARFQPKIYYFEKNQTNIIPKEINIISPMNLIKAIDSVFSEKGEIFFYQGNIEDINNIYLNIIFYFELFDLPLCVLYVQNDMDKFEKIKDQLKVNLERKNILKRKNKKGDFNMTFTPNVWNSVNLKSKKRIDNKINDNTNDLNIIKEEFENILEDEKNLWKNIQVKVLENKNNNDYNNKAEIEDKNGIINFIKEMKEYIKDSLNYFIHDSQGKLYKFLINYEKYKQKNAINIAISEESNEKNLSEVNNIEKKTKNRLFSSDIKINKRMFSE